MPFTRIVYWFPFLSSLKRKTDHLWKVLDCLIEMFPHLHHLQSGCSSPRRLAAPRRQCRHHPECVRVTSDVCQRRWWPLMVHISFSLVINRSLFTHITIISPSVCQRRLSQDLKWELFSLSTINNLNSKIDERNEVGNCCPLHRSLKLWTLMTVTVSQSLSFWAGSLCRGLMARDWDPL